MATFHKGDMWDRFGKVDLFCITTNGVITKDGRLVMGAGIAKEARDRLPGIDKDLAEAIQNKSGFFLHRLKRSLQVRNHVAQMIVAFQVKEHYKSNANLNLIRESCLALFSEILDRPKITIALNFPGIGYGGLSRNKVLPIISLLPDNVEIWEFE